jgi:hypothetical protein
MKISEPLLQVPTIKAEGSVRQEETADKMMVLKLMLILDEHRDRQSFGTTH